MCGTPSTLPACLSAPSQVPAFLLADLAALVPDVKARLGDLCQAYIRKEVARVFGNVLDALLAPMRLETPIFHDDWPQMVADAPELPADLQLALQLAVYQGPVIWNRDQLRARWEAHGQAILQLVAPAVAQLFADSRPNPAFQQQLLAGLGNLVTGSLQTVVDTLPELCQQVIMVVADAAGADPDAVARRVQQHVGLAPLHVGADLGGGCRMVMDSARSAFQLLQCEHWPAEWGFHALPLQGARLLLRNLPSTVDEATLTELIRMYADIHVLEVNMNRPFAELIVSTEVRTPTPPLSLGPNPHPSLIPRS